MQSVIPLMRAQGGGSIVNINSGTAFMTIPRYSVYSSSKRALLGFSLTARAELEKDHIVVSEVYPFVTATNFGKNRMGSPSRGGAASNYAEGDTPEFVASLVLQAIDEIFTEDCVFYDPMGGVYRGRDEIHRIAGTLRASYPDFRYQPTAEPEEVGNGGRVQWVEGRPGETPAHAGTDFIIARDGRIA